MGYTYPHYPLLLLLSMTGLTDLAVSLVGNLYGRAQEHEPLPTIILALVTVAGTYIQLTAGSDQRSFNPSTARTPILPEIRTAITGGLRLSPSRRAGCGIRCLCARRFIHLGPSLSYIRHILRVLDFVGRFLPIVTLPSVGEIPWPRAGQSI